MKSLVVYSHPWDGSFNHAVLESVIGGLKKSGGEADVLDLYKENFNPVLSGQELSVYSKGEYKDPKVGEYQKRIEASDHLIIITPMWWGSVPAVLKGFIDKVFTKGWAYEFKGMMLVGEIKNIKSATVITTMNMPKVIYWLLGSPIKKFLSRSVLKGCGIKNVKSIDLCNVTGVSDAKRKKMLNKVAVLAAGLK